MSKPVTPMQSESRYASIHDLLRKRYGWEDIAIIRGDCLQETRAIIKRMVREYGHPRIKRRGK